MKRSSFLSTALLSIFVTAGMTSVLSTQAHTYRFCNLGAAPVTVDPDLWGLAKNPDAVTIQPGQYTDFSTSRAIKGACVDPDPDNVSSCGDSNDNFIRSSHSGTTTFNLSQKPGGDWFMTSQDKLISCAAPAPTASTDDTTGDTDDSTSSDSSSSSSDSSTVSSAVSGTTTDTSATTSNTVSSSTGSTNTADTTTTTLNCVCNVGGEESPSPAGVTFLDNDCTKPAIGSTPIGFLSCSAPASTSSSTAETGQEPTGQTTGASSAGFPTFPVSSSSGTTEAPANTDSTGSLGQTLSGWMTNQANQS